MTGRVVGPFEVNSTSELIRTAICGAALIKGGEPVLTAVARSQPGLLDRCERAWTRTAAAALGLRPEISGLEYINPNQTYVVAPLHESLVDPLILSKLPLPLRYLFREELLRWKHLGRFLAASNHIKVPDHREPASARTLFRESTAQIRAGNSLVVFPQGSILGVEIAFNAGAFKLADRLESPLLPVVLTGGHRVWEHPFSQRLRYGQPMSMSVLPPLEIGHAVNQMRTTEQAMKTLALENMETVVRRFVPERDGFWDEYAYEIDPTFSEVALQIESHRSRVARPA